VTAALARCTARSLAALLALLGASAGAAVADNWQGARRVSRDEIAAAMAGSTGYALTATANGARLQAEVLLRLVRGAEAEDPQRRPLLIGHREWFLALLDRTGLTPSTAPLYARLSEQMQQDLWFDYRRERVVAALDAGPEPVLAANVRIAWPDAPGRPRSYSYDDELASPHLRVTQKRLVTYRLLEYADRVWYAEVSGLYGRPTSGALGVLFNLIGEARVEDSRSAVAADETQVVRGRATKWWIDRTATVTVRPDGHADKGVPQGRPDLAALERRLEEPLGVRFLPFPEG
jgi:hypothetical protein